MLKARVKAIKLFCLVLLFLPFLTANLSGQGLDASSRIDKGNEIIRQARNAIYKGLKPWQVTGVYLKKDVTTLDEKLTAKGKKQAQYRFVIKKEVSINFPFQIKQKLRAPLLSSDDPEDYLRTSIIANGDKVIIQSASVVDGEVITQDEALAQSGLSKKDMEKIKNRRKSLETQGYARTEVYSDVMPLLLREWVGEKEKDFKYVGKAKVGKRLTDILEIEQPERIKKIGKQRLFFDDESKRLIMMKVEVHVPVVQGSSGNSTVTYYFSDYQLIDGLLVAQKINTEAIIPQKDGSKQRIIQQITVKDFKLNPVFKAGTFAVKKEKN